MPRDKNKLPLDILYEFLVTASRNDPIYYNLRTALKKRFDLKTDSEIEQKYQEFKENFDKDPDQYFAQLLKSPRMILKWVEKRKIRFSENLEKKLFEMHKDTPVYYRYCELFNIVVDNYAQVVTEVAMGCKIDWNKKSYLETLLKRRKICKQWIIEFLKNKDEINENDSIKTLLDNL